MHPNVSPSIRCLSWLFQNTVDGKGDRQLDSLENPTWINICWVLASLVQRCESLRVRDSDYTLDVPVPISVHTAQGLHQYFTVVFDTQALLYVACTCRRISTSWQPTVPKNWISACWSCLERFEISYGIFTRLWHITLLSIHTNVYYATNCNLIPDCGIA